MIQDPFGIFLALAAAVFLAVWLEGRYRFFRSMSAGLMCLVFGMVLSNSGLLPGDAEAYYQLGNIWVNAAIVLVLLNVDLRTLLSAGKPMLGAFGLGALGTMLGTLVAFLLLSGSVGRRGLEADRPVHRDLYRRRSQLLRARERLRHRPERHVGGGGRGT